MAPVIGPNLGLSQAAWQVAQSHARWQRAETQPPGRKASSAQPPAQPARLSGDLALVRSQIAQAHYRISKRQAADDALQTVGDITTRMQELANQVVIGPLSPEQTAAKNAEYARLGAMVLNTLAESRFDGKPLFGGHGPVASPDLSDVAAIRLAEMPADSLTRISKGIAEVGMRRLEVRKEIRAMGRQVDGLHTRLEEFTGATASITSALDAAGAAAVTAQQIRAHADTPPAGQTDTRTALALLY